MEKNGRVAAVVIIDDIAATGKSLAENIEKYLEVNGGILNEVKVRVMTIVATAKAQMTVLDKMKTFDDIDIDFRSCEILDASAYAFPAEGRVWKTKEEEERARALCIDLGSRIYKQSPLGYGGLGLLVVFPATVPNNSLPILHSYARAGSQLSWKPLFVRVVN